jgi:hypothetical protein
MSFMTIFFLLLALNANSDVAMPMLSQFQDKESAGWAYKVDDQAFEMKEEGCRVRWNVETPKDPKRMLTIAVREDCPGKTARAQEFSQSLLKAVISKYPKDGFKSVISHSWCHRPEWEERMAVEAVKESKPRILKTNAQDFARIFAKGRVGIEETEFFASQGLELSLTSVEKVQFERFKKLNFAFRYPEFAVSNKKVPYTALCWFTVKPIEKVK